MWLLLITLAYSPPIYAGTFTTLAECHKHAAKQAPLWDAQASQVEARYGNRLTWICKRDNS